MNFSLFLVVEPRVTALHCRVPLPLPSGPVGPERQASGLLLGHLGGISSPWAPCSPSAPGPAGVQPTYPAPVPEVQETWASQAKPVSNSPSLPPGYPTRAGSTALSWSVSSQYLQLLILFFFKFFILFWDGASGKEPTCQCRRLTRCEFDPGWRRSLGGGHGNPLQYSYLENPLDTGNLAGCSLWGSHSVGHS